MTEKYEYKAPTEREERAREAAKALSRFVNDMGHDPDAFADEVARDHRTLQSQTVSLMLKVLYRIAENDTDLRNEVAVAKAKKVVEALGPYGPAVPFI
jgi:hypothetical protein